MKVDVNSAIRKLKIQNRYLKNISKNKIYKNGINKGIYRIIANMIYDLSQVYVPVETGYLKSTGKIVENSIGTYSIVYSAPYAKFVHEIMENRHEYPGRAKFLEDAAYEILNIMEEVGVRFEFTFSMDTSDDVVLHLGSLSVEDFEFNRNYNNYIIEHFFGDEPLENKRTPESEVLY